MRSLKGFFLSLSVMAWLTPAAAEPKESYYFSNQTRTVEMMEEVSVTDWSAPRSEIEKQWLSSRFARPVKYDISKFPLEHLVDAKLDHMDLLSYDNLVLVGSNPAMERKLVALAMQEDPFARAKAIIVLNKMKAQDVAALKPLVQFLKVRKQNEFVLRQFVVNIFTQASPNLDEDIVAVLKEIMRNDENSPVRARAALAVLLNSEHNPEGIQEVVEVMVMDQRDIVRSLHPWAVINDFMKEKNSHMLAAPTRPMSKEFKKQIVSAVENYKSSSDKIQAQANLVRNVFIRTSTF